MILNQPLGHLTSLRVLEEATCHGVHCILSGWVVQCSLRTFCTNWITLLTHNFPPTFSVFPSPNISAFVSSIWLTSPLNTIGTSSHTCFDCWICFSVSLKYFFSFDSAVCASFSCCLAFSYFLCEFNIFCLFFECLFHVVICCWWCFETALLCALTQLEAFWWGGIWGCRLFCLCLSLR